ncbi:MAG TPA: hypothetical protein VN457_04960, partial [Chlamydiales bacterium]|nr:hypothetical protein [Chlamydiales bacterium]
QEGPFALLFPFGYCLGFLCLGLGFGARLRALNVDTASDIFERFYASPLLKKIAASLSVISLTGILIAQAVALKKFLISSGWSSEWIFLASWAAVIIYTTQGGFLAVVWTDTVQAVVMIGMLLVAFFLTLETTSTAVVVTDIASQWTIAEPKIIGYLLIPCLFTFIEQDMCQRCFAAKSSRDVKIAGFLSCAVLFCLAAIPVVFGMMGAKLGLQPGSGSVFMEVVNQLTSKGVSAIAASAVLLAIISTASSLLSAVSSNVAQDFGNAIYKKPISMKATKAITLAIGVIALVGSYTATGILSCMIASYELSVGCLFVPFVAAVFLKEAALQYDKAAMMSVIAGACGFVMTKTVSLGMCADFVPLAMSGAAYGLGVLQAKRAAVVA